MDRPSNKIVTNRSVPAATVIPVLAYEDVVQAASWLCDAFGFSMRLRIANHRIQLTFGDGAVIATNGGKGQGAHGCHSVLVRVEDADSHYARAKEHGAHIVEPPTDQPYGERQYSVIDPGGHRWTFSQSIADPDPEEWGGKLYMRG